MNEKKLIQRTWVIEIIFLIINFLVIQYIGRPAQMEFFLEALPLLTGLIVTQGIIAGAGPEMKRWIETKKNGPQN